MVKAQSERYQCNQCPQVLKDLKPLQIHKFVDHQHESMSNSSPSRIPPPPSNAVTATPRAPPPQAVLMYPRQSLGSIHPPTGIPGVRTSFSHGHGPPPPTPVAVNHFSTNGHGPPQHGSMSREGSVSSDSGEGAPLSPALKCELCGLSNFPSNKTLQQVI